MGRYRQRVWSTGDSEEAVRERKRQRAIRQHPDWTIPLERGPTPMTDEEIERELGSFTKLDRSLAQPEKP